VYKVECVMFKTVNEMRSETMGTLSGDYLNTRDQALFRQTL